MDQASKTPLLDKVQIPDDLRRLPETSLQQLVEELRQETIDAVSVTGGHLGAGLGVVELTVALHWVFDNSETGAEVTAGHRYGVDRFLAQLGRELRKFCFFELAQILGRFDAIEKRRLRSAVHRAIPCCDLSIGYVTLSRPRKGAIAAEGCAHEKRGSGGSRAVGRQSGSGITSACGTYCARGTNGRASCTCPPCSTWRGSASS